LERGCVEDQPQHVNSLKVFRIAGALRLVFDTVAVRPPF